MLSKSKDMDYPTLLTVNNLTIYQSTPDKVAPLLENVTFSLQKKEKLGIIGPSGSGKSLTLKAILGILPVNLKLCKNTSITFQPDVDFKKNISFIPQNPQLNLNPLISIGKQLQESLDVVDTISSKREKYLMCLEWIEKVGLQNAVRIYQSYPHELSGGQLQRVIIAMALCQKPALIIADEPTTALDPILQNQILTLLFSLTDSLATGVIIISHDIALISKWTHRIIYLRDGKLTKFYQPVTSNQYIIKNKVVNKEVLLEVSGLSVRYKKGWLRPTYFKALENISFTLHKGERFGIIGVSGSGKSSLAKAICGLIPHYEGEIKYALEAHGGQLIFQNPYLSLNPSFNVHKTLNEATKTLKKSKEYNQTRISEVLSLVGLNDSFLPKFPIDCSGGEQQRIAIARALCVNPDLLILDESLASLDVDRQISMMNVLIDIQNKTNISILFISHDMRMVTEFCDQIMVLSDGSVIASGSTQEVLHNSESKLINELMLNISK